MQRRVVSLTDDDGALTTTTTTNQLLQQQQWAMLTEDTEVDTKHIWLLARGQLTGRMRTSSSAMG